MVSVGAFLTATPVETFLFFINQMHCGESERVATFQCFPAQRGKPDKKPKCVLFIYGGKRERVQQSAGHRREKTGPEGNATASAFHSITSFGGAAQTG